MLENIKKNIRPLSGAIFIAVILWFGVSTTKEYIHTITVPLEIKRLPENKTLFNKIPQSAKIELKGSGQALIALNFYDVKFSLELPQTNKSLELKLKEYIHFLSLPARLNLEILEIIEPTILNLEIDDYVETKKIIKYKGNIKTESGYILHNIKIENDTVLVSGPAAKIKNLEFIFTEEFNASKQTQSFNRILNVATPFPDVIRISPEKVNVLFDIQRLVELPVYAVPIKIINIPANLEATAEPPKLTLRVKGAEKIIQKLSSEEIEALIDFRKNFKPGKEEYAASIKTPDNVEWIESIPKTFKLKVRRK